MSKNQLHMGDCLSVLQHLLRGTQRVDLIYLDPPFNSNAIYHITTSRGRADARRRAFSDTWRMTKEIRAILEERIKPQLLDQGCFSSGGTFLAQFLDGLTSDSKQESMLAYLVYMIERLLLMKKLLNNKGSIYLHCDPSASHYLKVVMDAIFGAEHLRNEIIWYYNSGARGKHFGKRHDTILWYAVSDTFTFNKDLVRVPYSPHINIPRSKSHYYHPNGKVCDDVWQIPIIAQNDQSERSSYPTQKPLTLLDRIVKASSRPSDLVLDPFCGSGTTLIAALQNDRQWIGIDRSEEALKIAQQRLSQHTKNVPPILYEPSTPSPSPSPSDLVKKTGKRRTSAL